MEKTRSSTENHPKAEVAWNWGRWSWGGWLGSGFGVGGLVMVVVVVAVAVVVMEREGCQRGRLTLT